MIGGSKCPKPRKIVATTGKASQQVFIFSSCHKRHLQINKTSPVVHLVTSLSVYSAYIE